MPNFQTKAFLGQRPINLPTTAAPEWVNVDIEFNATTYAIGDLIELCEIPAGYKPLDFFFSMPDVDSGGSPTWAFSVGEENAGSTDLANVWQAAILAGQASAMTRSTQNFMTGFPSNVNRKIAMRVTAAPATYAGSGKVGQFCVLLQG